MPSSDKYTDPKLRDEIKEDIQESDKGGQPGQWSARKAQMMASEYKKRGGGYTTDKSEQDSSQKNLEKWGDEEWQTKDGEGKAKQDDGTEKRYLPKKAWEQMSEQEKEETDDKKQRESKQGKQFVGNTDKAKDERKKVSEGQEDRDGQEDDEEQGKDAQKDGAQSQGGKGGGAQAQKGKAANGGKQQKRQQSDGADGDDDDEQPHEDVEEMQEGDNDEYQPEDDGADEAGDDQDDEQGDGQGGKQAQKQGGKKGGQSSAKESSGNGDNDNGAAASPRRSQRKRSASGGDGGSGDKGEKEGDEQDEGDDEKESNKKAKTTHGSKHDSTDPPNDRKPASASRLPNKGQEVTWKAMPGWVTGIVQEILTSSKKVEGKDVKASKDDPRISLKSNGPSGKTAIHKPAAVYF